MDLYRVTTTMTGTYINGTASFRHYFDLAGGTAAQAHAAVLAMWTSLATLMNGTMNLTVQGLVEQMDAETGSISNATGVTAGTASSLTSQVNLPWQTAALLQWRTGAYYATAPGKGRRELRGRLYVPMQTVGVNVGGKPTSAHVTSLAAAAAGIVSHSTSTFGIWRRPVKDELGNITRDGAFAPAISGTAWDNWATMRSRRD